MAFVAQDQATTSSNKLGPAWVPLGVAPFPSWLYQVGTSRCCCLLDLWPKCHCANRERGSLSGRALPDFSFPCVLRQGAQHNSVWGMLNHGMARVRHPRVAGKVRGSGPLNQQWKLGRAFLDSDNPVSCLPVKPTTTPGFLPGFLMTLDLPM